MERGIVEREVKSFAICDSRSSLMFVASQSAAMHPLHSVCERGGAQVMQATLFVALCVRATVVQSPLATFCRLLCTAEGILGTSIQGGARGLC